MADRIELIYTAKGSSGEDEDWWTLVIEDDGKMFVEHAWRHINAYKFRVGNSGIKQIAVGYFLSGDYNSKAQHKLGEELTRKRPTMT